MLIGKRVNAPRFVMQHTHVRVRSFDVRPSRENRITFIYGVPFSSRFIKFLSLAFLFPALPSTEISAAF